MIHIVPEGVIFIMAKKRGALDRARDLKKKAAQRRESELRSQLASAKAERAAFVKQMNAKAAEMKKSEQASAKRVSSAKKAVDRARRKELLKVKGAGVEKARKGVDALITPIKVAEKVIQVGSVLGGGKGLRGLGKTALKKVKDRLAKRTPKNPVKINNESNFANRTRQAKAKEVSKASKSNKAGNKAKPITMEKTRVKGGRAVTERSAPNNPTIRNRKPVGKKSAPSKEEVTISKIREALKGPLGQKGFSEAAKKAIRKAKPAAKKSATKKPLRNTPKQKPTPKSKRGPAIKVDKDSKYGRRSTRSAQAEAAKKLANKPKKSVGKATTKDILGRVKPRTMNVELKRLNPSPKRKPKGGRKDPDLGAIVKDINRKRQLPTRIDPSEVAGASGKKPNKKLASQITKASRKKKPGSGGKGRR
tara:strand:+ start:7046 stop:8305 length:1260 start_codon:yes stop_codon:yes gene_type:complete